MDTAAVIIERAADVMQRRGKCEVVLSDELGRVCVWGAIAIAEGNAPQYGCETPGVYEAIRDFSGVGLICWSDGNDEATVIAGLRAVAATLRAQESTPVAETVLA